MASGSEPVSDSDELASLVTRCILAFERGGATEVDAELAARPTLAEVAREQLALLRDAGLLVPPQPDPEQIGPYRVIRRLGSGGVGSVFLAEQSTPVRRQVAIKVIRPGMDSREVLARFAVERQTLALLDHPNVARVLDAGTTADGRPYLCMDYVRGQPITQYCDERGLDLGRRVALLANVCDVVQAAHQKGILHRDLKPSNILVSDQGGQPWPTVIDFGVAKSLGPRLLDVTVLTGYGRLVGTLEYMSPEQASNEIDVDTRTDVYALGVVLYELLSGRLPLSSRRLRSASADEFVRILREEDPPAASAAAAAAEDLEQRARQRATSPAALERDLRGELDWVVGKAIEKDRNRRYGMAAEFAADLRCYLRREPVQAGPPTTWYRWRKLVARHRYEALSAAAMLALLLGGFVTSLMFYFDAARKTVASEASLDIALEAVERMVQAGEDRLDIVPRMAGVRRELLAEALELHRRLAATAGGERVQWRTARALAGLARIQAQLGEDAAAMASADEALALVVQLPPEQRERPATVALIVELLFTQATWASALGAPDERVAELLERAYSGAEDLLRRGQLTADQRLLAATVLARRGTMLGGADAGAARTLLERSRALLEPFLADPATNVARLPQVLSVLSSGAKFLLEAGDIDIALGLAERLHAIVADEHERDDDLLRRARLLPASEAIASIFYRAEKFSRAIDELRPAIATRRELVRDFPAVPAHRQGLGRDLLNSALSAVWSAQFDDAAAWTDEAVELFGALIEQHPTSQENRRYLLQAYTCVAHNATARAAYRAAVDWRDAEAAIARGRALSADPALLADRSEAALDYRAEFAYVTGRVESKRGRPEAAATAFATALDCYGELRERQPATISYAARLVDVREGLARALLELGRHEEAAPLVEAAIATQRELDPQLASRRKLADKQRRLHELRVRVDIARGEFDGVLPGIDALLALSPAVAYDWEGHDRAARLAFEAARLAPADSEWRERFAARCRAEVESTIPGAATYESTSEAMLAVMSSNSVRTLVALEQELGNHAAAAAAQARVAAGYDAAFEARGSERNRERAAAAWRELSELRSAAGDGDGAAAAAARARLLDPR